MLSGSPPADQPERSDHRADRVGARARASSRAVGHRGKTRSYNAGYGLASGALEEHLGDQDRNGSSVRARGTTVGVRAPNASDRVGSDGCLSAPSKDVRGRTYTPVTPLRATGVAMPEDVPDTQPLVVQLDPRSSRVLARVGRSRSPPGRAERRRTAFVGNLAWNRGSTRQSKRIAPVNPRLG